MKAPRQVLNRTSQSHAFWDQFKILASINASYLLADWDRSRSYPYP